VTADEAVLLAARIVVGGAFLLIGLRNIPRHGIISSAFAKFPAPKLLTAAGIAMQIGFGALMASGFYPAVAAAGLLVFTIAATLMAHSFWTYPEAERGMQINAFLGNAIMAGGLLALLATGLRPPASL
jgi:putative oxidoreductase